MKTNVDNSSNENDNIRSIKDTLESLNPKIQEAVSLSLKEANSNSTSEKELIKIWASYLSNLSDFFFLESEKTGNKNIYKKITKYLIFRR